MLRSRGLVLVPEAEAGLLAYHHHLRAVSDLYAIDCVLDVGANRGQFYELLRGNVGYRGVVHSFEPVSAYAKALQSRAQDDQLWRVHAIALGSAPGEMDIKLTSSPGLPSLLEPDLDAMRELLPGPQVAVTGKETIQVRRLDAVLPEIDGLGPESRVFLKLDTKGFDLEVLHGAGDFLAGVAVLQTELSVQPIYRDMADYRTVLTFLEQWGFAISGIFPVILDRRLSVVELDCVMVNRRHMRRDE